jgi:hypothetical protein
LSLRGYALVEADLSFFIESREERYRMPAGRVLLVEAFITTEGRSPLDYVAKPFMEYFSRAFREA